MVIAVFAQSLSLFFLKISLFPARDSGDRTPPTQFGDVRVRSKGYPRHRAQHPASIGDTC
jgi:hypothetical protein